MSKAVTNAKQKANLDHLLDTDSVHRHGNTGTAPAPAAVGVGGTTTTTTSINCDPLPPEQPQPHSSLVGTNSVSDAAALSSRKRQRLTTSDDASQQGPSSSSMMHQLVGPTLTTTTTSAQRPSTSYPLSLPTAAKRMAASSISSTGTGKALTGEQEGFQGGPAQAAASRNVHSSSPTMEDVSGKEKKGNEATSSSKVYKTTFPTSNRGRRGGGRKSFVSSTTTASSPPGLHPRPPEAQAKIEKVPASASETKKVNETTSARAGTSSSANSVVPNPTLDDHTAAALLTSLYEVPVRPRENFLATADVGARLVSVDEPSAAAPALFQRSAGSAPLSDTYTPLTYTDFDVLLGKGGLSNNHPGNKAYVAKALSMQDRYKPASTNEKTQMSKELVQYVHDRKGRFMVKQPNTTDLWVEVDFTTARKKASRLLRGDSRRNPEDGTFSLKVRKSSSNSTNNIDTTTTKLQVNSVDKSQQINTANSTGDITNDNNRNN